MKSFPFHEGGTGKGSLGRDNSLLADVIFNLSCRVPKG